MFLETIGRNRPKIAKNWSKIAENYDHNTYFFPRVQDPIYVLENNIPIDAQYYLVSILRNSNSAKKFSYIFFIFIIDEN
jgi:hypothetical protein